MGNETSQSSKNADPLENDIKLEWRKVICDLGLVGKEGHSMSTVSNRVYVFGGVSGEGSTENNELLALEIDGNSIKKIEIRPTGPLPAPRTSCQMCAVGHRLFLFGGLSKECGWFDFETVHMFNTESNSWSQTKSNGTAPPPMDKFSSAVVGENIYIFGGFGPQGNEEELEDTDTDNDEDVLEKFNQNSIDFGWFNSVFVYDTVQNFWSCSNSGGVGAPTPRAASSMNAVSDKYLVIFGGRDAECRRNDLHVYDIERNAWLNDLKVSGRAPEPRSFHSAVSIDDRVLICGGRGLNNQHFNDCHILNTGEWTWARPDLSSGELFATRAMHTLGITADHIILFGGSSDFDSTLMQCRTLFNDIFILNKDDVLSGGVIKHSDKENDENVTLLSEIPQNSNNASKLDRNTSSPSKSPLKDYNNINSV